MEDTVFDGRYYMTLMRYNFYDFSDGSGGELIAIGASGMSQSPSSNSSQSFIFTNVQNQKEDSEILLKDLNGNEIVKCNSIKSFSNIVISSPKLEKGDQL